MTMLPCHSTALKPWAGSRRRRWTRAGSCRAILKLVDVGGARDSCAASACSRFGVRVRVKVKVRVGVGVGVRVRVLG